LPELVIHLFGVPRIDMGGKPVTFDTRKAMALMAYLAVGREVHSRDTLAALLWPDYDQSSARGALRRTLSTLNQGLMHGGQPSPLDITRESLAISPGADFWLDVTIFRGYIAAYKTHGHAKNEVCPNCITVLAQAVELYSAPFMAGFSLRDSPAFEEWQFFQEEGLRRELASALEKLVLALAACERLEEAIIFARRWLALDTLTEDAHAWLMRLYARSNQRNAALRQYRECLRILDEELGVAPLEETTRLYQAILNHEVEPEQASRLKYLPGRPASSNMVSPGEVFYPAPIPRIIPEAQVLPPDEHRLIGRRSDLDRMIWAYQSIRQDGCLVILEGEAGMGKTRLAEEFLQHALTGSTPIWQARCYHGEAGLAYAPIIFALNQALAQPNAVEQLRSLPEDIIMEAGRLVPDVLLRVGMHTIPQPAGEVAQFRFFEALRHFITALLAGSVPGIFFIDDLHWADHATLELLSYLVRRLAGLPILVLVTWRSETSHAIQSFEALSAELVRKGQGIHLTLPPLTPAEITELVENYPQPGVIIANNERDFADRLYQESEGSPFIAWEYLAARRVQQGHYLWEVPSSVRTLLHARLNGLDSTATQLVSAAAVIGRSFNFDILREASGRSEMEIIDGIELLINRGLVIEQPGAGSEIRYDFTHENLRGLIYEETSLTRRRLLHRRVAEAIQHTPAGRMEQAGRVAFHYERAGLNQQAAEYHRLSGEHALGVFAIQDALDHFHAALENGHPERGVLSERIGDLQTLRGAYDEAIQSYHVAASLLSSSEQARLEHKLGNVHHRRGEWDLAESHYQASMEASEKHIGTHSEHAKSSSFLVHLFADRSMVAHARGDQLKARELADESLALAQASGEAFALAQAWNVVGVVARASGDSAAAISALQASLSSAQALLDPLARVAAMNNLALVYGEADRLTEAIELARSAIDLCRQRGDRHREAALHNNLADLLHRSGQDEEAMTQLKQAVILFAEIGAAGEVASAEIWKLTEW
jgi:DNA-binding SARP family transcriptional activator/predicted ATPase